MHTHSPFACYLLLGACLLTGSAAYSQTVRTWIGTSPGQFNVGSNWTPTGVPSGTDSRVRIDNGAVANADVVLSSDTTIGGLSVTIGDQFRISSGITLTLQRVGFTMLVDNAGTIAVGAGHLKLDGDVALNGFGELTLAGGEIKATTSPAPGGGDFDVITNRSDIKGHGTVVPAVENGELIQANVSGQTLSLQTVVDNVSGILEASSGGTLAIGKSSTILNSSGLIRANAGATVTFLGTIMGGSLHNNGGTIKSVGRDLTQLEGITITGGKIQILPDPALSGVAAGNEFYLKGTIINRGELACEGMHPTAVSHLGLDGPVQLQGGGSLKLSQGGPGTGGPAVIMRYNFPDERLINGLTPPPPKRTTPPTPQPAPTTAQQHTIEGAGRIEVVVLNQRGGTISNPATATGPLVLENLVTNLGTITSAKALTFQGVNGFTVDNEPGGKITATGGTFGLNSTVLANKGELKLTGNTAGAATGSIINTGTMEVSGTAVLTLTNFSPSATPLRNNGTLRILGAGSVNLNAKFEQSPNGTLEIGFNSAADFGRIHALAGGSVSTLAGKLTAVLAPGFTPAIGTQFQVFTGACTGRFTSSPLVPLSENAALQIIHHPALDNDGVVIPNLYTGVSVRVVAAWVKNASSSETVNGLAEGVAHYATASNGATLDLNIPAGPSNSLGISLSAEAATAISAAVINMRLAANSRPRVSGAYSALSGEIGIYGADNAVIQVPEEFSVGRFATVHLTSATLDGPVTSAGIIVSTNSGTRSLTNDGMLVTRATLRLPQVKSALDVGGRAFEGLRQQVRTAIRSVRDQELNEQLVIETTRIVAMGGGNIVANGGGNLTIVPGGVFKVSDIYATLRDPGFDVVQDVANQLAIGNSRFSDPSALRPLVNGIVTLRGDNFTNADLERAAGIVANGGGNFSGTLDLNITQVAMIVAVGGANIVANGGGNFNFDSLDPHRLMGQVSTAIDATSVNAAIVAMGGGNLVELNRSKLQAKAVGGAFRAPRDGVHPRDEILNRLVVNGDYTQSKAGLTRLQLRAVNRYDQIVASGKAVLDGTLGLLLADPDALLGPAFAPPNGSFYDVIIAPEFTIVQGFQLMLPGLAAGQVWSHEFLDRGNGTMALRLSVNDINAAPEIAVERRGGAAIADGGSQNFGTVESGNTASVSFTIRNTGTANLTGLTTFIDGADPFEFTVSTEPAAPVSGGNSTTFTVDFSPFSDGTKTAVLHIASNDPNENPYDITLTGTSGTPAEGQTFADWAAAAGLTGINAQPHAVPHDDGVANWLKYAFGMNGNTADRRIYDPATGTPGLPNISYTRNGTEILLEVIYQRRLGSGLTYTPKKSFTLAADSWMPLTGPTNFTPISAEWEQVNYGVVLDSASAPAGFAVIEVFRQE